MQSQPSVLRTLSQPATLKEVRRLLSSHAFPSRTALADHLCESLDLRSPLGAPQRSSCLAALRRLDARGHIDLPASVELLQGLRGLWRQLRELLVNRRGLFVFPHWTALLEPLLKQRPPPTSPAAPASPDHSAVLRRQTPGPPATALPRHHSATLAQPAKLRLAL